MRSTSSSRRVAGLLAATTIGLSAVLVSAVGVASADEPVATESPAAPTTEAAPTTTVESPAPSSPVVESPAPSSPVVEAPATETPAPVVAAATAPGVPVFVDEVLVGDTVAEFRFTPGATGDSPPVSYEYQLDNGAWTAFTVGFTNNDDLTGELSGLTNLREYTLKVRGVSAGGTGAASAPTTFTPYRLLPAPTSVTATVGVTSIRISWTPAADTNGVAGYEAFALPEGQQNSAGLAVCDTDAAGRSCVVQVPAGGTYNFGVHPYDVQDNLGEGAYGELATAVIPASATPATLPKASAPLVSSDKDGVVKPGESITLTGDGYLPGSNVELIMYSTPVSLGTVVAAADGSFTATVTLPAGVAPGSKHNFVAAGVDANGNPRYLVTEITVAGGATAGGLAYTGFSPMPFVGAGALALVAGGGLLVASRRRAA